MKTKIALSVAVAAVAALMLAGCSSANGDPSASPSPSGSSSADAAAAQAAANAALETVQWSADDKGVPTVTFDTPFSVSTTAARMIKDGSGEQIAMGQVVTLDYTITSGTDGKVAYSTYDKGTPESVMIADGQVDPVLLDLLDGAHVGANFLYAAVDTSTTPKSSVVMAVTVAKTVTPLAKATGTAVTPPAGLPVVTLDATTGSPSVAIPKTDAPKDLVAQPLIKGAGAVVKEGDSITVHYTGWLWDGTKFDSSWDRGTPASFTLTSGSLINGWIKGLAGQTVGSQVLLVVPPADGYGSTASSDGSIPANSTLVFVVDILAVS